MISFVLSGVESQHVAVPDVNIVRALRARAKRARNFGLEDANGDCTLKSLPCSVQNGVKFILARSVQFRTQLRNK